MAIRFVTGLDWSGDPGDPRKTYDKPNTWLVAAACHVEKSQLLELREGWGRIREATHVSESHVFKYTRTRPQQRQRFLVELTHVPLRFSVMALDKRAWSDQLLRESSGRDRLIALISALFRDCEPSYMAGQVLLFDGHKGEAGFVRALTGALRDESRHLGRRSFKKVSVVPDHRVDSMLIQAADMVAGEVRAKRGRVPETCKHNVDLLMW